MTLLQNGGLDHFGHCKSQRYEDTFVMGPDVVDALKQKTRIMRAHWLDVQQYLTSPDK